MNIRDLKYFIHLAETLSFTKTAEAFYVSQPSISIALKRLEDNFETTLIQRNRSVHNIQLTETGEILYQASQEILQLLDKTKMEIKNSQTESVTMGLLPTIGGYYLPVFHEVLLKYQNVLNFLEEENSDVMFEHIRNNQVSISVLAHEQETFAEKWLTQHLLEEHEMAIYVAKSHPLASKEIITMNELVDLHFITLGQGFTHNKVLNEWLKIHNISLSNVKYSNELQTIKSIFQSGLSPALLSDVIGIQSEQIVRIPIESAPKLFVSLILNNEMPITNLQAAFNNDLEDLVIKYGQKA